jgi:hypothetical protein
MSRVWVEISWNIAGQGEAEPSSSAPDQRGVPALDVNKEVPPWQD